MSRMCWACQIYNKCSYAHTHMQRCPFKGSAGHLPRPCWFAVVLLCLPRELGADLPPLEAAGEFKAKCLTSTPLTYVQALLLSLVAGLPLLKVLRVNWDVLTNRAAMQVGPGFIG